jgi:hypothetical protein
MRKTAKGRKNKRTRKFRQTRKQKGGRLSDSDIDADQLKRQKKAIKNMIAYYPTKDINEIYTILKRKQLDEIYGIYHSKYKGKVTKDEKEYLITYEELDDSGDMEDSISVFVKNDERYPNRYDEIRNNPDLLLPLSDEQILIIEKETKNSKGEYMSVEGGGQKRRTNFKKKTRRGKRTIRR